MSKTIRDSVGVSTAILWRKSMKYLQKIASAYGFTIQRGSCDGYNGYHVYNRHHISVGVFFDSLDSVADYFANKIKGEK
jgi:hypothetical protein